MKIQKILIAVDDNKYAEHAAEWGFDIAQAYKAEVGLVNIIDPIVVPNVGPDSLTGLPMAGSSIDEMEMIRIQTEASENMMKQILARFAGDLKVTHFTEYGTTADGILKCGKEFGAELIVTGTHSRTGLDRLLMGSVAAHLIRHSSVPVLVVPLGES